MADTQLTFDDLVTYKEIPRLPGYRFGNDGSAWSRRTPQGLCREWHRLSPILNKHGYLVINVRATGDIRRTLRLHSLILEAFVRPPPPGMQCCHINGNSTDNRVENLRWGTAQENIDDRERHGMTARGEFHKRSVLTEAAVRDIRKLLTDGVSPREIARRHGVSEVTISSVKRRKTWAHVV